MAILLALAALAPAAHATDIYVDGLRGNNRADGTRAHPVQTTWHAIDLATSGDTIHLLPTITYPAFGVLTKSGTPAAPITITGDGPPPNLTRVRGNGTSFGFQINTGASYIAVTNLDIAAPGGWSAIYVGRNSHHVAVIGNTLHDSGLAGISTTSADYLTIRHNIVYGNATYTAGGAFGSGISTYENKDIDASTGVKSVIDGNIVYANTNTPTKGINGDTDSDGSGIIIDDSRHFQHDRIPYHGTTLIENNVVFGNGGRGIYAFISDHVLATNNTVFHNNLDPHEASWHPGEIMVEQGGGDIRIYNNIAVGNGNPGTSHTNTHTALTVEDATDGAGPVTADYNMLLQTQPGPLTYFGDGSHQNTNRVTYASHNQQTNPLFIAPDTHPRHADFHLQTPSPARAAGNKPLAAPTDITGTPRPQLIDLGAYQQTR